MTILNENYERIDIDDDLAAFWGILKDRRTTLSTFVKKNKLPSKQFYLLWLGGKRKKIFLMGIRQAF